MTSFSDLGGDQPAGRLDRLRRHADEQPVLVVLEAGADPVLQRRIERDHVQPALRVAIAGADRPGQPVRGRIRSAGSGPWSAGRSRRASPGSAPTGGSAPARAAAFAGSAAPRPASSRRGSARRPRPARCCFSSSIRCFVGVAGEDFVGVLADRLGQVRGDHAARLDHRVAEHLGLVAHRRLDPQGGRAEGRVLGGDAGDLAGRHAASRSPGTCPGRPCPRPPACRRS